MGAGTGRSSAPKRQSLKKIVERLNETWGSDVNVVSAARAVNFISDYVAGDDITQARITNSANTKEAILNDGRLSSIVKAALVSLVDNEMGELAARIMNDPQAISSLADQAYDQLRSGKRYDIPEIQKYIRQLEQEQDRR